MASECVAELRYGFCGENARAKFWEGNNSKMDFDENPTGAAVTA